MAQEEEQQMSRYTVYMGGFKFDFDDGVNAISFVEVAVNHFVPGEYTKTLDASVHLKSKQVEDVKEESNNDNDK